MGAALGVFQVGSGSSGTPQWEGMEGGILVLIKTNVSVEMDCQTSRSTSTAGTWLLCCTNLKMAGPLPTDLALLEVLFTGMHSGHGLGYSLGDTVQPHDRGCLFILMETFILQI